MPTSGIYTYMYKYKYIPAVSTPPLEILYVPPHPQMSEDKSQMREFHLEKNRPIRD